MESDNRTTTAEVDVKAMLEGERFFHDMQLPGHRTGTWVYPDHYPPNYHLLPSFELFNELDLKDAHCLDIGTYDGMSAFVLSELGAKSVHALCQHDLKRFRSVRAILSAESVKYYPSSDIRDLPELLHDDPIDLVVISAMLHHLVSPLDGLLLARTVLKCGGMLILETILNRSEDPELLLNTVSADPVFGSPTLWVPSRSALKGMLSLACFDLVAEIDLLGGRRARETNYDRATFLARAVRPSHKYCSEKTREVHDKLDQLGPLNLKSLKTDGPTSTIEFKGQTGQRYFNIWNDSVAVPLQPTWTEPNPATEVSARIGRERDYVKLVNDYPDGKVTEDDIHLLTTKYPGESVPEGMTYSLKQLGNLHVLDWVTRWGLKNVLEVGPGFNFYFPNHLPSHCAYTSLDKAGYYNNELIMLARKLQPRGTIVDAELGESKDKLSSESYDACVSVSVLEHVPEDAIQSVADEMYRILEPGGWALHSIDFTISEFQEKSANWLRKIANAGFLTPELDACDIDPRQPSERGEYFGEARSIALRFYGKYQKDIWKGPKKVTPTSSFATLLVAVRKPLTSK